MPAGEEKKFVILKQESQTRSHSCTKIPKCNLSDSNEPLFKDLTPLPRFHHVPARVEDFIGRHRELHEVIKEIQNQRLLIIQGVHGVGKSSLCREAANFLHERNVFEDGIIYLKAGGCDTIEGLLSKLDVELGHISKQIDSIEQTAFSILTEVTKRLFDVKDTLIIFDNIDDVYHNEGKKFKELVEIILVTCPRVRMIITSRTPIGGFPDVTEKVIKLGTLDMSNARELFFLKSPRQISDIEMKEFLEYNYASRVEMMLSSNTNYLSMHRDYGSSIGGGSFLDSQLSHENINHESRLIEKHPLMIALGGHPQAISLAAALLDDKSLKDVSCSIISDPLRALKGDGFMASGGSSKDNKSPIEISLNTSLQYLKERDGESYKFFGLLGLLPGGAQESDFEVIWGEGWEECVTLLLRYSLIIRSGKPNSLRVRSTKYMLYPFMIKYAEDLLAGEDRNNYCYKILIHLRNEAEKIFNKVGNLSPDSETFVDIFHKAETNFKACLRRELQSISRYTESPLKRSPEKQLQPQEEFGHSLIPGNKDGLELLAKFKEMRKSAMENKNQRETIKKDLSLEEIKPTEKAASFLAAPSINASFHSQRRSTRLGLKKGATVSSYGDSNKGGRFTFTPSNRKDGEYKKSSTLGLTPTEKMSNSRTAGELKEDHVFVQEDSSPIFELEIIRGHSKTLDYKRDKMIFNQKSHITEKSEEESRSEKPQFKSAFDINEVEPELKEESKREVHVELAEEESHKLLKAINEPTPSVELQEETSLCDLDDNNKSSQQNTNDQDLDPEDGNVFRFFDPIIHKPLALIPKTVLGVIEVVTVDECYDELMKELSGPLDALDKTILNDRVETPTIPSIDIFRNQDPSEKSRRGANQELLEGLLGGMHSNTPPLSILDSCFKEVSFGDPQDFLPELSLGNNSNIKSIPDSSKPTEDKNKDHKLTITITRASDSNSLEIIRDANGMRPVRSEDKKKMLPSNHLAVLYCSILFLLLRFSECTSLVKKYMNLSKDSGDTLGEANLLRISGCLNWVAKKFDFAFEDFTRASKLFKEAGCCLGEAICEAATGYLNLRGFTPSDESMIQNDFDKLEHALKIYNQLDHMYGVYHIHRWLSLLMDKVPTLRARGKRHASEAKRALSVSKKNNLEFSGSHKAGTFVLRSMGDPFSILLEIANFCDDTIQNNSKPNANNPHFNPFDRSKPLITLVEEEEKDLNQTINKGSPEHNSLEPTPSSGRNSSRRTSEKIGLMPCFKKKSLVPIDPSQNEHLKKNGEKNHKQIEDNI